jgi:DNA-binding CsgD family transcriptional regulator
MSTLRPPERLDLLADMTRAELARGNPQAAARWCEQVQRLARPDQPGHIGIAELTAARLALRDDPATAAQRARYAAELALKAGRRLDSGHALLLAAAALAAIGDDRAEETHAEASAMLAECGAGRLAHVLDEENRLLRGDPQESSALPAPDTVPEFIALSEREMQIAELVSHGHTNRQIARLLSLSHKTVETYLARIFSKLGVSSRSSVATLVGCGALGEHNSAETCIGRHCATSVVS